MKERMKNIPYWIYDILSLISAIITILTAGCAMFKAVVVVTKLEGGIYEVDVNPLLVFLCILMALLAIICFVKLQKYGTVLRQIKRAYPEDYYMFLREFRNAYFEILKGYKANKHTDADGRIEILTTSTKMFLGSALDYLCDLMEKNTGRKVCASVKLIENLDENIDKDTATVVTFCRSKNSDSDRMANDNNEKSGVQIKDNTDFYEMLNENRNDFYQSDLLQYSKDLKKVNKSYLNTTHDWEKYYQGTIVVPIRVARKQLHYLESDDGYDVIGFLCVDSMATDAFRNNVDKSNNIRIVKSFAAELYIILNKYKFYLSKIDEGRKQNV